MSDYIAFLASKDRRHGDHGDPVTPGELHATLHGWQQQLTAWAIRKGRAALFADCGLGKTLMQVEWARHSADRALIIAPLSVARQTVREARKVDATVTYVRDHASVGGAGIYITNYEMADQFDPAAFGAVVLDESSILKAVDGKTRRRLTAQWHTTPRRLCCTATPAPNDVAELANHAAFLGAASREEMLAAYFTHDSGAIGPSGGWRLKGHAAEAFYSWVATWAAAVRQPSDLGWPDDGYALPPLRVHGEIVDADVTPDEDALFRVDLGGVKGRAQVRRETMGARVERAAKLAGDGDQWIVWCGLNDEATAAADAIDGAVNVPGSWSPEDKARALEAFQDGETRVLVTKPTIAGFGMNFQNAHRMSFVGLSDSYEAYYQAIRRCWRYGQQHPVDAHVIVSELERQIVDNVRSKQDSAETLAEQLAARTAIETRGAAS